MADLPQPIRASALDGVAHGFFGRDGGVSTGTVAGLQVGFGAEDDPAAVAENRRRVVDAVLPGAALAMPYQVHSPDVAIATHAMDCLLYTSPSPRDGLLSRMPSSA